MITEAFFSNIKKKHTIQLPISGRCPLFWGKNKFASVLPTMTAIAKALLHTWTVFCIVTAEPLNNRTKLANTMNHPLGWYAYCCQVSWQSGWPFWRNLVQDQSVGQIIGWTDRLMNCLTSWCFTIVCTGNSIKIKQVTQLFSKIACFI